MGSSCRRFEIAVRSSVKKHDKLNQAPSDRKKHTKSIKTVSLCAARASASVQGFRTVVARCVASGVKGASVVN
ncbi:hypothetical protein GALMADRAFT_259006 [Galerina marginata CBS 339.88]|uniref:Uncharacterized protein n=1 Tax=Galerina marginata (strain CBS 339.88) TaxID=685588 RepID=A0A067SIE1_GALM3|nr:hypothetical protein GALMADRAFT_259006 [Galerina marginata CBS 339.88]